MSTTIESLELEILSSSQSAESGLDKLSRSLEKVKLATKGGLGLTAVAKQIRSVKDSTSGISADSVSNINGLAKAIQLLSGTKISPTVAKQITAINTALSGADFSGGEAKITELVTALKPLESLGKSSLGSTVSALKKLPDALNNIDTRKLYNQINSLTRIFKPLADEMQKIANGFSAFPAKIQKLISNTDSLATSNNKAATSYINLYAKIKMAATSVKSIGSKIASMIQETMSYYETINLFSVSMGQYAKEAADYAEQVSNIMGIDPAQWMKYQGTIMTLATGFGIAGDRAYTMSQQLTQLAYDISSFREIGVEEAMQKIQSGFAGELEPLRAIGYDLSQAKLEAIALSLGIDKSVSSMTQAEKAQLRYYAIMTQVTAAQGDMARTLTSPANQMRIFKAQVEQAARAIGSIFIPALNAILPYAIAVAKVVRALASSIASLFGFEMPEVDYSGIDVVTNGANDASDALDKATESAKKLKSYMLGFDELNVINPDTGSGSSGDSNIAAGGGLDFELPTYDFIGEATESRVSQIVNDMKEWLGITDDIDSWADLFDTKLGDILILIGSIATGLLAWKFSDSFSTALSAFTTALGLGILIDSISVTFEEGLSWKSVIEGAVGGALIGAGLGFKFGGVKGAIGGIVIGIGISLVVNGITGALADGVDVEDVVAIVTGVLTTVGGIIAAVKLFNTEHKNPTPDIDDAAETIKSTSKGVSKLTKRLKSLATNLGLGLVIIAEVTAAAVLIVGAIWLLGVELENVGIAWQPVIDNAETVATAIGVGTALLVTVGTLTNALGKKGKTMAARVGIGTAILLEIGAATILFVAEIWAIGKLLDEVGEAWQPVLDNGETIKTAVATGTVILVAVGALAAALGVATTATGYALPIAIGLGTAILVELGVATGLFLTEIKAIAKQLDKIGEAWQPVLDNGETIESGIKTGTKILIAIGGVTAALGAATVATVGLLPLAIGLGTALLLELNVAFEEFTDSMIDVADKLSDELHPELADLNKKLPTLSTNMSNFTSFMKDFAGEIVSYTKSTALASIAATIDKFVDLFTTDPIKRLNDEISDQYDKMVDLIDDLKKTIPKIESATELLSDYNAAMEALETEAGGSPGASGILGFILQFGVEVINDASEWWDNVKKWWKEKVGTGESFKTNPANDSTSWWSKVKLWWATKVGNVSNFNTNVNDKSSTWWANVLVWWNKKKGDVSNFDTNVNDKSGTWWEKVKSWWRSKVDRNKADSFKTNPANDSTSWWSKVKLWWKEKVSIADSFRTSPKNESTTWWENVKKWWKEKVGTVESFKTSPKNESTTWWDKVKEWWKNKVGTGESFKTSPKNESTTWWDKVKEWWKDKVGTVSSFKVQPKDTSTTWWTMVKSWWDGASSSVSLSVKATKGWSSFKKDLGIPETISLKFTSSKFEIDWTTSTKNGTTVSMPSKIYTCATGGFPDIGQMFIAREAGPELVGTIGSRNAVVNNDQIVESVSAGVYQAVVSALGSSGSEDGDTQIVINLDGEKIYENQQKIARNRGYNLGMGAFSFG